LNGQPMVREFTREKSLLPRLKRKHTVLMDHVKFHVHTRIKETIGSAGAPVIFLSPYSPDLNPIEHRWSTLKNTMRKDAPRTTEHFEQSLKGAFESITQNDLIGWFKHCGYKGKLDRTPL